MRKKIQGAELDKRTVVRGGFLGVTPQMLALASIDDRVYAELDRESRELPSAAQVATAAPKKVSRPETTKAAALGLDAGSDWIDQYRSPLGKRKHMELCRAGVFPSARKEGKKWLVRRADIDAHVVQHGKAPKADATVDIDRELEALGMIERENR